MYAQIDKEIELRRRAAKVEEIRRFFVASAARIVRNRDRQHQEAIEINATWAATKTQ